MKTPPRVLERIDASWDRYLDELLELLRIPSVSADTRYAKDVRAAADWVSARLEKLGVKTRLLDTGGHPLVLGELCPHADAPTLLVYGHYDVQPPEPLDEWVSPPFEPRIEGGYLHARGATDDKGQLYTHIMALDAIRADGGMPPINLKFLIEGEEEVGSRNLGKVLREHREDLRADAIAISDTAQFADGMPAITCGLRGLAYMEILVQGPRIDLHSGVFGGVVANPIQALASILDRLKDADGRVLIPGFYDDVLPLDPQEREEMAALALDEEGLRKYLGVSTLVGEPGYIPLERKSARPTLDVNGIWGGYAGEGPKTVIPARAGAKVSMRLVPNQKYENINELFKAYVKELAPAGVEVSFIEHIGGQPVLIRRDFPEVQAAARAIETGFGKAPVFIREGGSIPIVNTFIDVLETDRVLLLGWGGPDDGAHSPNEKFSLDSLRRGAKSAAALYHELAQ